MDRHQWGIAALMGSIHFTFHLFMRLLPPLIPVLALALGYPLWKLGLLVSVYFVGSSVGLVPMGVLSDRYDRRALLSTALGVVSIGFVVFSVSDLLGTVAPGVVVGGRAFDGGYVTMVVAMGLSGIGTSAHVPVGVPILTANADDGNTGRMLGVWGGASKLGDAAAPALVGVLLLVAHWRSILLGFGLLGVVLAGVLFVVLGREGVETVPPDRGNEDASDHLADRRSYLYPMVVLMGYFAAYNLVVQGVVTFTPTFVTDVYGYALSVGGVSFGPESVADFALSGLLVAAAIARFAGGAVTDRYEHRAVLFGSLLMATVAMFALATLSLGPVALPVVLVAFGVGLWGNSPARDSLIDDMSPAGHRGRTFSYLFTASRVFGALSPVLVGWIAETSGIRTGFRYLAGATLVAALFVAMLFSDRVYAGGTG